MTQDKDEMTQEMRALAFLRGYGSYDDEDVIAEAMAAFAAAEREREGWRPIETVPKIHGEQILVTDGRHETAVVEWLGRERVTYGEEEGFVSGWYISDGHNDPIWYRAWPYITHWQHLPSAPQAPSAGEG